MFAFKKIFTSTPTVFVIWYIALKYLGKLENDIYFNFKTLIRLKRI